MLQRAIAQDIANLLWGVGHIQEQHQLLLHQQHQLNQAATASGCTPFFEAGDFISPQHVQLLAERMLQVRRGLVCSCANVRCTCSAT